MQKMLGNTLGPGALLTGYHRCRGPTLYAINDSGQIITTSAKFHRKLPFRKGILPQIPLYSSVLPRKWYQNTSLLCPSFSKANTFATSALLMMDTKQPEPSTEVAAATVAFRKWMAVGMSFYDLDLLRAFFIPWFWSNYSDLTRPHPKRWFSKGNPLISRKSGLVKSL